uniref:Pleiotrophin/Midkine C-terminal domain-containing protein n=1 Tax=Pinctada fucata TaxID=50426 RepID=A0A194API0_PINFU
MKMRCKYSVSKGDCDPTTQRRTKTYILKDGSDSNCNPTFTKEKPCRVKDKCKYKPTRNSVCDDNGMIELERKSGSDPNACAPTKQVKCSEKMIRKMQRKKNKMNKKERRKNRKERRQNRAKGRHMMNENE